MLRGAVQKHEKEVAAGKATTQSEYGSSPPLQFGSSQLRNSQPPNSNLRNLLKPTTSSSLNGWRGSRQHQAYPSGIKRTASGLAKALDGSFEDAPGSQQRPIRVDDVSPQKGNIIQVTQHDFIDENDFDSDIELDIEEPPSKKTASYPKLPPLEPASHSPSNPILYPTLPRQQQVQTSLSSNLDSTQNSIHPAVAQAPPGSSAPIPWSSSPAEHFAPVAKPSIAKAFTFKPPNVTQSKQNGPPPPQAQPKPAKRRVLPWSAEETADVDNPRDGLAARHSKVSNFVADTPVAKNSKQMYPWNTTMSAVKEQQKRHREEAKKSIKKNDADEDGLLKAKSNRTKTAKVFLSEEQQHVLDLVIEQKKSVFFTGSAGTGKSVLMREIISSLRKRYAREPDRVAVTASTGLAACNVGGVTLHSFAGIGLGKEDVPELVRKVKKNAKAKNRWMRTKILVVDEVSMVDGELFDKLEAIARQIRNNGRPFGGIQLVITGDFFQLPPVPENGRLAKFAFDAATWKTTIEHTIGLHHVFRQKDPIFAGMLNEMREGRLQQSSIDAFRKLARPLNIVDELEATELFPTRTEVEHANQTRLNNLQGDVFVFEARDGGAIVDKTQRDRLLQNCMAPESITLKKGAQVMLIKNIDESLVNGSLGRIMGFMDERQFDSYSASDEGVQMSQGGTTIADGRDDGLLDGGMAKKSRMHVLESVSTTRRWPVARFMIADGTSRDLLCQPETWKVELPNGEIQASRAQIPLILAWALSIHKAQGQTLERVKVDLGKVFEKGQAYVALSRATSMNGLQVLRFDPKKVVAHEKVRTFYGNLQRVELAEKNKERLEGLNGKRKKSGAEDYERRFVEDEWDDDF